MRQTLVSSSGSEAVSARKQPVSSKQPCAADIIAGEIIAKAKGSDVEYNALVDEFIFGKSKNTASFGDFARNSFREVKDFDKVLSFCISISSEWKFDKDKNEFKCLNDNGFSIKSDVDKKNEKYNWNESVSVYGKNIYSLFEQFKAELKAKLDEISNPHTEVILDTE